MRTFSAVAELLVDILMVNIAAGVVCQSIAPNTPVSAVEVRRLDVTGSLRLQPEPVYENFFFTGDIIKLIVHQPLSKNLYAFGTWVCCRRRVFAWII